MEGNSASPGDNLSGSQTTGPPSLLILSHDGAKSHQENHSTAASLQGKDGGIFLGTNVEPLEESGPSQPNTPLEPGPTSSCPCHSNTPLLETKPGKETDQLMKVRRQNPSQRRKGCSDKEWTFYPHYGLHTYHTGKKCIFDGIHLRTKLTTTERSLDMSMGKKKYVTKIDPRNGIPMVTLGDHPYTCPEHSKDFHKKGASVAPVNFGRTMYEKKSDTFIPLQRLPSVPCVPFRIKEKQQELEREKLEVKNLNFWKPAPSLLQSFIVIGPSRKLTFQPY